MIRTSAPGPGHVEPDARGDVAAVVARSGAALVSAGFLAAGLIWPYLAGALLRVLLVALAAGYVAVLAWRVVPPARRRHARASPFDGALTVDSAAVAPLALRRLTAELGAATDPGAAQRTAIPWAVRRTVIAEAARRLAEGHGLRLVEPQHHPRIRALLAPATWRLIAPDAAAPQSAVAVRPPVPLSELSPILDDLERL